MSSRGSAAHGGALVLALVGLALPFGAASAQAAVQVPATDGPVSGRAAEAAAAQARIDSLTPLVEQARERARAKVQERERAERERRARTLDTLQVGPLRALVPVGEGGRARPYYEAAWAYYEPLLGGEIPPRLGSRDFVFRKPPLWRREAEVRGAVRHEVGKAISDELPAAQRGWIGNAAVGFAPAPQSLYRELVLAPSRVAERCRAGAVEACWDAMGAVPRTDPLADVRAWYTQAERRLVAGARVDPSEAWAACAQGGVPEACDAYLAERRDRVVPLGGGARASVVALALELGGEGALTRFARGVTAPPDFREAVGRTAGMDPDAVMTEWHRRVTTAAPDRAGLARGARLAALFWVLVFLGLSTRSTRWRLG